MAALEQAASSRELTPSPSWSFLISISYAMSPLLFPACPGIYFLPSVVQCFPQKPPERRHTSLSPLRALSLSLRKAF